MRSVAAPLLLALTLCAAVQGQAQSPPDRQALQRWRDSLEQHHDTLTLRRMAQSALAQVRAERENPMLHLRRGFSLLQLADLDGTKGFEEAAGEFEWAAQLHPEWPYPWLGAGLAELGLAASQSALGGALDDLIGGGALERSVRALVRSATVDPAFVDGVRSVGENAMASHSDVAGEIALRTLRELSVTPAGKTPELLLARARIEREFGTPTLALEPLERFVGLRPSSAIGWLELARTRFVLGQLDGVEPWFEGLSRAAGTSLAEYRGDLAPLGPATVLDAFDRADAPGKVAVMRRFWATQDPDRLPATAERMRDHYIRLDYARRHFRLLPPVDSRDAMTGVDPELDDRGSVYVRHGAPETQATVALIGVRPNESWGYHPLDGNELLFHFILREDERGYRQYHSLLDVFARSNQFRWYADHGGREASADTLPRTRQTYGAELSAQIAQQLMLSRWNTSSLYRQMLGEGKQRADSLQALERAVGERSAALQGSWSLRYELPLPARLQVLAVGRESSGGTVQVLYSVRANGLLGHLTPRGPRYTLRIRVAVVDSAGSVVAVADTTRDFIVPTALGPGDHLNGRLPVNVPPGTYAIRVAIESDSHGLISSRQEIQVYPPDVKTLSLSDLAMGARSVRLGWRPRANDTAWVNPLRRFSAAEPMQLYFEVSGVAAGEAYRTKLAIFMVSSDTTVSQRAEDVVASGGTPAISLGFSDIHPGGVVPVHREISLQRLKPGEYVLQVTLETGSAERVVRRQPFVIARETR